jgi:hypothetical protein
MERLSRQDGGSLVGEDYDNHAKNLGSARNFLIDAAWLDC